MKGQGTAKTSRGARTARARRPTPVALPAAKVAKATRLVKPQTVKPVKPVKPKTRPTPRTVRTVERPPVPAVAGDVISLVRAGASAHSVYPIPREEGRVGRPSKYDPSFCDLLVEHLAGGNPLETFAARVHVSVATVNNWFSAYPEFLAAKTLGEPKRLAYWVAVGKAIALDDPTSQLALMDSEPFVKKRTVTRKAEGTDPKTGEPLMVETEEVEYHTPRGNTAAFCYMMTNMFRNLGWRNDHRMEVTGEGGGPIKTEAKQLSVHVDLTAEELMQLDRLLAKVSGEAVPPAQIIEYQPETT